MAESKRPHPRNAGQAFAWHKWGGGGGWKDCFPYHRRERQCFLSEAAGTKIWWSGRFSTETPERR